MFLSAGSRQLVFQAIVQRDLIVVQTWWCLVFAVVS